jgi:hypothetical protein
MLTVRLKQRTVLEPGCRVVDPGTITQIPESWFDPTYHELIPAVAAAPAPAPAMNR